MSACRPKKQRATLDFKYKVNGDLLLLIKDDLPWGDKEREGGGVKGQPDKT